jgi:glutamate-1-semialdehyde 2,1-aminomutase
MFAIRAAMAFTGRNKVIKIEGGYHGTHDIVEASVSPSLGEVGEIDSPKTVPNCLGIPTNVFDNVVIAPFNDQERMRKVVQTHKNDLAAIIVEPILGVAGVIPANKDYLVFLRELTRETGSLLIFDEIVSFRVAPGGAQEYYGVIPDLTVLGKIIGGGLPVGAFGGREDVMELFSPQKGRVPHAGTFNGHPLAMVAGLAAMQEMTTEVYAKINSLGDSLRRGITNVFHELDIKAKAGGVGSLIYLHYTLDEITNYRDSRRAREQVKMLPDLVNLCLLNHGIFIASRGQLALSTPMTNEHLRQTVQSFYDSFEELKPFMSQFLPNLISG